MPAMSSEPVVAVDSHVHIHDAFDIPVFLNAAADNFARAYARADVQNGGTPVMLLTETARANWFDRLRRAADRGKGSPGSGHWTVTQTSENCSLTVRSADRRAMHVIAGHQVVTQEKLEVLTLGTCEKIEDGTPIRTVIERSNALGAITVVPWGFGKWLGRRGEIVRDLIVNRNGLEFFLGDNSGRLRYTSQPAEFELGTSHGLRVLPGSDPLPFRSEQAQAGRYGFLIEGRLSARNPAIDLQRLLGQSQASVVPYGRREGLLRFVRNQVKMQLVTRVLPSSQAANEATS